MPGKPFDSGIGFHVAMGFHSSAVSYSKKCRIPVYVNFPVGVRSRIKSIVPRIHFCLSIDNFESLPIWPQCSSGTQGTALPEQWFAVSLAVTICIRVTFKLSGTKCPINGPGTIPRNPV